MTEALYTVREAAERLGLHVKTVLRFIRDGRLAAHRIGKSYRLKRSDVEAFAGLPAAIGPGAKPLLTAVVDIPDVAAPLAERWMTTLTASLKGRGAGNARLDIQVVHDRETGQLKIIALGDLEEGTLFLGLVRALVEQLRA
jgi:excisionase family DNA binding protein